MTFAETIYKGKTKIKNIIFDWGGVIIDLHFEATKKAFLDLGLSIFDESVPHDPHHEIFIPFEIGKITPAQFCNRIREYSATSVSDEAIENAWNAMLGALPAERWQILQEASKNFRTFLLSNTNAIHMPYYYGQIKKNYGTDGFVHLFEKTYYSHEIGLRKPDSDIFEFVIRDAGIIPGETMFIDDFIENIETAHRMGFWTIHMQAPLTLANVFKKT